RIGCYSSEQRSLTNFQLAISVTHPTHSTHPTSLTLLFDDLSTSFRLICGPYHLSVVSETRIGCYSGEQRSLATFQLAISVTHPTHSTHPTSLTLLFDDLSTSFRLICGPYHYTTVLRSRIGCYSSEQRSLTNFQLAISVTHPTHSTHPTSLTLLFDDLS